MNANVGIDQADLGACLLRFPEQMRLCETLQQIAEAFAAAVLPLGMTVSASGMVSGPKSLSANVFHFVNWPPAWLALYLERGYDKKDPVPRWAIISGKPIAWTEMMQTLAPDDPGHEVFNAAREWGYSEGFITPVRAPDGSLGLISVGGPRERLDDAERVFLQAISTAALHRAEAISAPEALSAVAKLLSRRERECVSLLLQGFTDREIGTVLGVSEATARFHIDNARRKLGARSRPQLVALVAAFG